jgi:hypothetical protein
LDHPSIETLAKLLAGDLSHEDLLALVIPHLVEQCPGCRERYEEILGLQTELGHWDERVVVMEGRQAPDLLAKLAGLPIDRQLALVTDDESFHTWGLCQLLLARSLEASSDDPGRALDCAELAVEISQHLGEAYDPNWVLDLRARAWAVFGNAQRALGELRSANTAFREAEALLGRSMTGNDLVRAEVLRLKAGLRRAQGRSEEAAALEEQARSLQREGG